MGNALDQEFVPVNQVIMAKYAKITRVSAQNLMFQVCVTIVHVLHLIHVHVSQVKLVSSVIPFPAMISLEMILVFAMDMENA